MTREETVYYLKIIKEISNSITLIDIHTHPFDIVFNNFIYSKNPDVDGIYSINNSVYAAPKISFYPPKRYSEEKSRQFNKDLNMKLSLLTLRQTYGHIGPGVFNDQMKLSGISKIVLLPVLNAHETDNSQMDLMTSIFGNDDRFLFGYCIPNSVQNEKIVKVVQDAIYKYNIKVLKLHPNITGIDLTSSKGIDRVEIILEASRQARLPVVVHGGRSSIVKKAEATSYSTLNNLQHVDWSISGEAIVIAHAGMFELDTSEIREGIPLLMKLLSKHDNLFVDVSGMGVDEILFIVKHVDLNRIVFGSDALYYKQWVALLNLLYVLQRSTLDWEAHFVKITSTNPTRYILTKCV